MFFEIATFAPIFKNAITNGVTFLILNFKTILFIWQILVVSNKLLVRLWT